MAPFDKLLLRRGTAAEWAAVDPVLESGEPGFETDTGVLKAGDGVTAWSGLSSIGGAGDHGDLTGLADNDHPQYLLAASHPHYTLKPDRYYGWSHSGTPAGQTFGEADLHIVPVYIPHTIKVARLGILVNTTAGSAGAVLRFGIYADDGAGQPGALLIDGGTVSAESLGWKEVTFSPMPSLTAGTWWLAFVTQGAAGTRPQVQRIANAVNPVVASSNGTGSFSRAASAPTGGGGGLGFRRTTVTGTLPDPAAPTDSQINSPAVMYLTHTSFS